MGVQFLEQKSCISPDGRLSANYLKCKINDIVVEFPYMNATKQDYDKSSEANPLQSQHFQFFVNELDSRVPDITTECRKTQISTNFLNVVFSDHPPIFTDITLYYNSHEVGEERRKAFLDLQKKLKTTFLSDIEVDKNQGVNEFKIQLEDLSSIETNQIKSPTISMSTPTELFVKKLEMIFEKGYDRFNVEWGGQTKYSDRWLKLSKFLVEKRIICNMVSINQKRNYYDPFESYVVKQFMLGVHSCSTGYGGFGGNKNRKPTPQKSFVLNENTWNYNERSELPFNFANTSSHNTLSLIANDSHAHILDETYFTNFVPQNFEIGTI